MCTGSCPEFWGGFWATVESFAFFCFWLVLALYKFLFILGLRVWGSGLTVWVLESGLRLRGLGLSLWGFHAKLHNLLKRGFRV